MTKKTKERPVEASNYGTLIILRIIHNNKNNLNVSAIKSNANKIKIIN